MKRGRKLGSKNARPMPARYEGGFGPVNFWLAILLRAMIDFNKWHYSKKMVNAYVQYSGVTLPHFLYPKRRGKHIDALEEAWWVCEFVKEEISD